MDKVELGVTGVSKPQIRKLMKGGAINVKRANIVSPDDAPYRITMGRGKAKKMLGSFDKGKGYRLAVMPNDDLMMMEGGKLINLKGTVFDRKLKSPAELRDTFGVTAISKAGKKAVKGYIGGVEDAIDGTNYVSGVTKRGFNREIRDSGVGKEIAKNLIDVGANIVLPAALGGLSMLAGDPTGISGNVVGSVAGKYLYESAARKGYGLYKKLSKVGISKKMVKSAGKALLKEAAKTGGEALTAYTGNPAAGAMFEKVATTAGNKAIDSSSVKKTVQSLGPEAKMLGIELIDDYADEYLQPTERRLVERALVGKYPNAKELIYDYGNSKLEQLNEMGYDQEPIVNVFSGYGIPRRTRQGLRMGGAMASKTPHYIQAMKSIRLGGKIDGFRVADDRVVTESYPSSSETIQTGSPFQRMYSPAMSPFIAGSPQLTGFRDSKMGGSIYAAGYRRGGSFLPA
jgi:hypothetical protein